MNKQINQVFRNLDRVSQTDKQSVRTTFKLSDSSNDAIDWLIKKNNLKPKEIFDLMCSNENFVDVAIKTAKENQDVISTKQTRKTFVISRGVLRLLNRYSKEHELSRDVIVENLISLFKMLLEMQAEAEKPKEEEALKIISDFWSKAESLEDQLKALLGDDSPILDRFGKVIVVLWNLVQAIESKLSNGTPIDPDDMSQQS